MSRRPSRVLTTSIVGLFLLSLAMASTVAAAAPLATNDNFAGATVITSGSLPYEDAVNASAATAEVEATDRCDSAAGDSIWYTITPNFSGALLANTIGTNSSSGGGDLTIYRGTTLAGLTEVACNTTLSDDSGSARVTFKVSNGVKYYIRVTDTESTTVLHLRRVSRPSNDDFANAFSITGLPLHITTSNLTATFQYAEPDSAEEDPNCSTTDPTLWYTIRPGSNMVIRATVEGAIDTVVAVYAGTSLGSLTLIGCNDDTSVEGQGLWSNVAWRAIAGQRYYIQVGGYEGETGNLKIDFARGKPPANDNFANAETIMADNALHSLISTRSATIQINGGEPDGPADCSIGGSVWYKFVAPSSTDYVVETSGSEFNTAIAVYTGASLGALSDVASVCGANTQLFSATMGTTYWIQVSGTYGNSGNLQVRLNPD